MAPPASQGRAARRYERARHASSSSPARRPAAPGAGHARRRRAIPARRAPPAAWPAPPSRAAGRAGPGAAPHACAWAASASPGPAPAAPAPRWRRRSHARTGCPPASRRGQAPRRERSAPPASPVRSGRPVPTPGHSDRPWPGRGGSATRRPTPGTGARRSTSPPIQPGRNPAKRWRNRPVPAASVAVLPGAKRARRSTESPGSSRAGRCCRSTPGSPPKRQGNARCPGRRRWR